MAKGNILKEAIADAKAVREVALQNAKSALEEAFTPKLQNMLNAKLSEDLDETYYDEDEKDMDEGMGMYDEDEKDMDEAMYDEDEDMDEDMDEGMGMYDEDEKDNSMDEEIDLEEILNELELEEGKKADEKEEVDEVKKDDVDEDVDLEEILKPHYEAGDVQIVNPSQDPNNIGYIHEDEEFDLDSLLKEINDLDEQVPTGTAGPRPTMQKSPAKTPIKRFSKKGASRFGPSKVQRKKQAMQTNLRRVNETGCRDAKQELQETKKALNTVQNELNEVNLLNSKLLYVNRIFKANQLDDSQKLRVVETLDKADSTKEAKLIYETIKDTFNVAKSKKVSSKKQTKTIKENFRGMASKAAGMSRTKKTAPKRAIISETDNMVNRFQKLANIKINE